MKLLTWRFKHRRYRITTTLATSDVDIFPRCIAMTLLTCPFSLAHRVSTVHRCNHNIAYRFIFRHENNIATQWLIKATNFFTITTTATFYSLKVNTFLCLRSLCYNGGIIFCIVRPGFCPVPFRISSASQNTERISMKLAGDNRHHQEIK